MSITEFDEKAFEESLKAEGRAEGSRQSLAKLVKEGIISGEIAAGQLGISIDEMNALLRQ